MLRTLTAAAFAVAFLILAAPADPIDAKTEASRLALVRAKLRLGSTREDAPPRDSIRLVMSMQGRVLPSNWDPKRGDALITIGGRVVISLPASDPYAVARRRGDRWTWREKKSPDRTSRCKLVVDRARGRIVFRAKRMDLSDLDASSLAIEVTLDGRTWTLTVPLAEDGRDRIFRGRPIVFESDGGSPDPDPGPGPGPGPLPDPDPDPDPDPKPVITWQEMVWGYDATNTLPDQVVADTQAEYDALWARARGRLPQPSVDFTARMVVGIFLGRLPMRKVEIVDVKRASSEIVVSYRVVFDTRQYFVAPPPNPHYLFTMTKTTETIRFSQVP